MRRLLYSLTVVLIGSAGWAAEGYKAGTAARVITPEGSLWMAGYASRNKPCDTKRHDLWIKALALEDSTGKKIVLLTSDLCGIPRSVAEPVCTQVKAKAGLDRANILLNCSHTHCGPVVRDNLIDMYDMPKEEGEKIRKYTERLRGLMVEVILAALADLKPADVSFGEGTARFAVNRRQATEKGVINGTNPGGPVDHSVPVLKVESAGKIKAIVFGYACHNTTMQFFEWCGDYAGFAQLELEKKFPGAQAMFWIGCGADANPLPRSKIELCEKYGRELAIAASDVVIGKRTALTAAVSPKYAEIRLDYDPIPSKDRWETDAKSSAFAVRKRAEKMLEQLADKGKIADGYPYYPVQTWKFGSQLTWVALGGEVVIDYNLRLKKELPGAGAKWIAGYSNDVLAYIPSVRVLKEGGYEADSSQIYYGHPTKWAPTLEDRIVKTVLEQAR